jgi:hypothetical protein
MTPVRSFSAKILKMGVNPFALLPARVLRLIFEQAGNDKGPISVRGMLEGKD